MAKTGKADKRERQRRARAERKAAQDGSLISEVPRTAVFTGEEDSPGQALFWCEACHQRTVIQHPPPVIFYRCRCPICGSAVKFRSPPSDALVLPGVV